VLPRANRVVGRSRGTQRRAKNPALHSRLLSSADSTLGAMPWILGNIRWIMVVSGVLTATMVYAVVAPEAALRSTFGQTLDGPVAAIVVRNWGALITLVGLMLIYGAFRPAVRPLVLTVAGASKLTFIGLVLAYGRQILGSGVAIAIATDLVMVMLFAWWLVATKSKDLA
jgi:hypothetical protein